jgi:hypothetical protein
LSDASHPGYPLRSEIRKEAKASKEVETVGRETIEKLIDLKVTEHGTIIEEVEIICCMTGFRLRLLVEHTADGAYRPIKLEPG